MDLFIQLSVGLSLSLLFLYIIFDSINKNDQDMAELELETQQVVEESIACDYDRQFICPDCGGPFDGHECENCKYTEER